MLVSTLTKRGSLCSGASNGESRGHGSFQGTTASHRSWPVIQDTAHGTGYEDAHRRFAGKEVLRTDAPRVGSRGHSVGKIVMTAG